MSQDAAPSGSDSSGDSGADPRPDGSTTGAGADAGGTGSTSAGTGRAATTADDAADGTAEGTEDTGKEPSEGDLDDYLPTIPLRECVTDESFTPRRNADEYRVVTVCDSGCDHASLTAAVEAAQPMDEIRLAPQDYNECIETDVSPIAIVGDGGLARFVDVDCPAGAKGIFWIKSEEVRLSNLRFENYRVEGAGTPIRLHTTVLRAEISRLWVENTDFVLRGGGEEGELFVDQIKVKDVGFYDTGASHQRPVLNLSRLARLWLTRSTFSNFTQKAWMLGTSGIPHIELVCNVLLKPGEEEAEHSFHIFYPERMVMRRNYFHESYGRVALYNTDDDRGNDLVIDNNFFLFDADDGNFVGTVDAATRVTAVDNTVVGGIGAAALNNRITVDVRGNEYFPDRESAGISAETPIPEGWPLMRL